MKKCLIGLICLIIASTLVFSACKPTEQKPDEDNNVVETYDDVLSLTVSTDLEEAIDVSPYIYGQFIEHIPSCIYNGIWAEMIIDRKFYLDFNDYASPWRINDESLVKATTDKTLSGDHAATLTNGGILSQTLEVEGGEYVGYINAFTNGSANVKVTLKTKGKTESKEISVNSSTFAKYEFSFETVADKTAKISFECTSGEVTMDSLSLMSADNISGMRRDTLDLLKDMGGTIYRWPGGNFVSGYDWTDGIGNRDQRPNKRNLHYAGLASSFSSEQAMLASDRAKIIEYGLYSIIEPNDMGTDEFIAMCEYIGAEPYIVVNTGLGESDAAAKWVEYCNGSIDTEYGAKRVENGNPEPYNVVYWGIGNEMNGSHQLGYMPSQSQYILKHDKFITAMKAVDEDIKVFAVGDNYSDYTKIMMQQSSNSFDYIQEHFYAVRVEDDLSEHVKSMYDGLLLRLNKHRELENVNRSDALMSIDEYAYNEVFCSSRLKDAMGIGVALNLMIDNCDIVGMACYSSTVNATQGCITTTNTKAMYQGSGLVLKAYRHYMQNKKVNCSLNSDIDDVYITSTISEDGKKLSVAVVNATEKGLLLDGFDYTKVLTRASVLGTDVEVYNTEANMNNLYLDVKEGLDKPIVPAYSITVLVFEL